MKLETISKIGLIPSAMRRAVTRRMKQLGCDTAQEYLAYLVRRDLDGNGSINCQNYIGEIAITAQVAFIDGGSVTIGSR